MLNKLFSAQNLIKIELYIIIIYKYTLVLHLAYIVYSHGLHRSQIDFATQTFIPQCQSVPRLLPSPLVFLLIFTHFIDTLEIP